MTAPKGQPPSAAHLTLGGDRERMAPQNEALPVRPGCGLWRQRPIVRSVPGRARTALVVNTSCRSAEVRASCSRLTWDP